MTNGLLGKKLGMTQIYDESVLAPVTVIEAGPCRVVTMKTKERDGYEAVQLSFGEVKDRKLSEESWVISRSIRLRRVGGSGNFPQDGEVTVGETMKVDMFKKGDWVDVVGVPKGKDSRESSSGIIILAVQNLTVPCFIGLPDRSVPVRIHHVSGRIRRYPDTWGMSG